ncbi:unnamed protein product [Prorocentrum cordatum]|nr:unnamed protein product [Polarella glacialis]
MPRGSPPRCICLSRNTEVVVEPCHADAAELAVGGAPRPREATRGAPPLARSGSGQQLHRLLRPSGAVGARLPIMQDPRVCERAAQQGLRRARGHKPAHHVQPVRPRRDPEGEAEPRGQDDAEQDHGAVPVSTRHVHSPVSAHPQGAHVPEPYHAPPAPARVGVGEKGCR